MSFHPNEVARRGRLASIVLIVVFGALGARFFSMQILRHSEYALQSDNNRLNEIPLPAPRAIILDRKGLVIAENIPGYTVSVLPRDDAALATVLARMRRWIPLSPQEIRATMRRHEREKPRPAVVFFDAPADVVSVLEEHRVAFPGLIIQSAPKRHYPDSSAVSAFVGYTSEINEVQLESKRDSGYKSGQQIGKAGLELQYESVLRGQEGSRYVEVNNLGRVVRDAGVRAELAPVAPPVLRTNIDLELQRFTARLFADSLMGAAVALDPKTGGVLAIHSAPGYDPNRFIGGVPEAYYASLRDDPKNPLYNKAIQGTYAPGSTWKLATAIIALERNAVRLDERMAHTCDGGYTLGNRRFRCWERTGRHGRLNLLEALAVSCDVYFYQLGLRLTLTNLVGGGVALQLGARSGIDLPSEISPQFPPAGRDSINAYYNRKFPGRWAGGELAETLNFSIGQGANSQTVINMARFYTALATDGHAATPAIVAGAPERTKLFDISPQQLQALRMAMVDVVSSRGTAGSAAIHGVTLGGKTGTSQNPHGIDHGWFVGFAPAEDPKIVVAVFLEFGAHGSRAARVAGKIVEYYLKAAVTAPPITGN